MIDNPLPTLTAPKLIEVATGKSASASTLIVPSLVMFKPLPTLTTPGTALVAGRKIAVLTVDSVTFFVVPPSITGQVVLSVTDVNVLSCDILVIFLIPN